MDAIASQEYQPIIDLSRLPIVSVSTNTNYRIKICVNFGDKKNYTDWITDDFLIEKINQFILLQRDPGIKYGYFQKSNYTNKYSIILYCHIVINLENIKELYEQLIFNDDDLEVFGYFTEKNKEVTYLSTEKYLQYKYYDFLWHISPNSFIQVNPGAATFIHMAVKRLVRPEYYFCGLGGEMGVYAKALGKPTFTCLTNSKEIYDDCVLNHGREKGFYLVDYDKIHLKDYYKNDNKILVINISRNGLRELASQIANMHFRQIVYIGCCDNTIYRDMAVLTKAYRISNIVKIDQFPTIKDQSKKEHSYVIELTPL